MMKPLRVIWFMITDLFKPKRLRVEVFSPQEMRKEFEDDTEIAEVLDRIGVDVVGTVRNVPPDSHQTVKIEKGMLLTTDYSDWIIDFEAGDYTYMRPVMKDGIACFPGVAVNTSELLKAIDNGDVRVKP